MGNIVLGQIILAWAPGLAIFALFAGCVKLSARLLGPWLISWQNAFLFALIAMIAFAVGKSIPNPAQFIYQFTICVLIGAFLLGTRSKDMLKNELGLNRGAQLSAAGFALWKGISVLFVLGISKANGL